MDVINNKSDKELLQSTIAELAKMSNELKCAQQDLNKASSRLSFLLVLINTLIKRKGD